MACASSKIASELVSVKNKNPSLDDIQAEKQTKPALNISQELKKLIDSPKLWEEIKRIGPSLSKEQMENIQNEFQNAIKTEQFDDKTIQDLYKRTNKMFKEDSILRSYFPGYLKQKTNPLMDALENLKTLVTPTKDSIVDKMILGTFCIFNVVAGQSFRNDNLIN